MNGAKAKQFFETFTGEPASDFTLLAQSGSARRNYLATIAEKKFIVTENANVLENESFFYFTELFAAFSLNTPKIYSISTDRTTYVQEYLGTQTLSEIIAEEGLTDRTKSLVQQSLEKLHLLQVKTHQKVDFSKTFEYETYDQLPITNDLFYFKSFIADVLEVPYHKASLLKEFNTLTALLGNLSPRGLMIRDFQARNIMVNDENKCFFIDYQSAMEGPLMYDVVSFLYQAKANFPEIFKEEMLAYYFSLWDEKTAHELKNSLEPLQLIRFLQVLGAYGFRGLIQRKSHFMESLGSGIKNLIHFSEKWEHMKDFPELQKMIANLTTTETQHKIKLLMTS
ncbi:aminoglycoside phosphotransferase [Chryseobacterium sp. 6424]|uniref:aminoglycoside phosphotransferase family protein n=1 Tax=Chryseobacterium sp. 6424 TaxID=2039166 RepID=UPI000EFCA5B4|nr:phosphotransferase [Chryseobacterium sp. 6424]AYO58594.1 aminoglycoside phosphotransferase [Chryseobacterium sp. 6424]